MLSTIMENKYEVKNRAIVVAQELIKTTGIENITIDDVATEMHAPPKTIYEYFCGESQLIEAVVEKNIDEKKNTLQNVRMHATNSIEQVYLGWSIVSDFFESINNEALSQLKKYYTQSYKLVNEFKNVFLYNYFKLNIDTGITQEVYRHNIKTELLSRYLIEILQVPAMSNIFKKNRFGSVETEDQILSFHLYGIATEKGIKLIRKYKNEFLAFTSPY